MSSELSFVVYINKYILNIYFSPSLFLEISHNWSYSNFHQVISADSKPHRPKL